MEIENLFEATVTKNKKSQKWRLTLKTHDANLFQFDISDLDAKCFVYRLNLIANEDLSDYYEIYKL